MKVKELLDKPEKWTKYESARDKNYNHISALDKSAVCFCLQGAIIACNQPNWTSVYHKLATIIIEKYPQFKHEINPMTAFNDDENTTFADIQKVLELADI